MAYLGTHVCARKTKHVYFDTDAVEVLLVTGCSITQSSARSDIITYKPSTGKLHVLGVHDIEGTQQNANPHAGGHVTGWLFEINVGQPRKNEYCITVVVIYPYFLRYQVGKKLKYSSLNMYMVGMVLT